MFRNAMAGVCAVAFLLMVSPPAFAVDGVVEINQASALAGGVTSGDTPGFPVVIDAPGSYRLTGNLTLPDAATTGVHITAARVTLDLNGFSITGTTICTGTGEDVVCAPTGSGSGVFAAATRAIVRNGFIEGVGGTGVLIRGQDNLIEGVNAIRNGSVGIGGTPVGTSASVRDCTSVGNGSVGLFLHTGELIENNVSNDNGDAGFALFDGRIVRGNVTVGNGFNAGIVIFGGAGVVTGNTSRNNTGRGIKLDVATLGFASNVVDGNTAGTISGGTAVGINLCDGSTTCP